MADYKTIEKKDYTTVNFETAYALTDEWNKTIGEFAGAVPKAADEPTLKALEEIDRLSSGFPAKFDTSMEELINNIKTAVTNANNYFDDLKKTDETILGLLPGKEKDTESGTESKPPGGTNPPGGGHHDDEKKTEAPTEAKTDPATEPATEPLPDNSEDQAAKFKTMSMSDLSEVVSTLNTLATANGKTIDGLLADDAFKDKIKEALLKNMNIPKEVRTLIEQGSSEALVIALKKLLNGQIPDAWGIDQDTSGVLKTYLTNIAAKNNTTLADLISKDTYNKVLKESLTALKVIPTVTTKFTEGNVQTKILDIYDGADTEIDDLSMDVIRDQVDVISELTDIPYNELLTEKAYAGEMLKSADRLARTATYAEVLASCSQSTLTSVLSSILK